MKFVIYYFLIFFQTFPENYSIMLPIKGQPIYIPQSTSSINNCLEQIVKQAYEYITLKQNYRSQLLLTFIVNSNLTSSSFYLQEDLFRILHNEKLWSIETLYKRNTYFKSYSENCIDFHKSAHSHHVIQPENCIKRHVVRWKTNLYLFIVDDLKYFDKKIKDIFQAPTRRSKGEYALVYYTKNSLNTREIASKILPKARQLAPDVIAVIPQNNNNNNDSILEIYLLKEMYKENENCSNKNYFDIKLGLKFTDGKFNTRNNNKNYNIFNEFKRAGYANCSKNVQALLNKPFVINETSGIEIEILQEISKVLNISLQINIKRNNTMDLGEKINNSYNGFLANIFDSWDIGIGNIQFDSNLAEDFILSLSYMSIEIVYIVPIAAIIPRWRVMMAIFTVNVWAICFGGMLGFALTFFIFKAKNEVHTFKTLPNSLVASFQIILSQPVDKQPKTRLTRVFFLAFTLISMIITCVYTSSLIKYLQNPKREHQISTQEELIKYALPIGGPTIYKQMFENTSDEGAQALLNSYQTVDEESDSDEYFLKKVARNRNIATIGGKLKTNYYLSQKSDVVIDRNGRPAISIIKKSLRTQQVAILMRKGNYLEDDLNHLIQHYIFQSGYIEKIRNKYLQVKRGEEGKTDDVNQQKNTENSSVTVPLSIKHLEGAFVLLALGYIFALFAFIIEIIISIMFKKYKRKKVTKKIN